MEQLGSHWSDFHESLYLSVFLKKKKVEKIHVSLKSDKITGTLHEDQETFLIVSRSVLKMRYLSDKKVVEKIKTHILCSIIFFENRTVCEIMWRNIIQPDRPQMTIWRMRISRWVPKATVGRVAQSV